jgi:hypothetical protein
MCGQAEFGQFVNAYYQQNQSGGTGAGFMGRPNPVLFPSQNISQSGYVVPLVPPPASSSSSSSLNPKLDPYRAFRNYIFNKNLDTNNYGAAYNFNARIFRSYNPELQSRDRYG